MTATLGGFASSTVLVRGRQPCGWCFQMEREHHLGGGGTCGCAWFTSLDESAAGLPALLDCTTSSSTLVATAPEGRASSAVFGEEAAGLRALLVVVQDYCLNQWRRHLEVQSGGLPYSIVLHRRLNRRLRCLASMLHQTWRVVGPRHSAEGGIFIYSGSRGARSSCHPRCVGRGGDWATYAGKVVWSICGNE